MLRRIARKECLEMVRDGRFRAAAVAVGLLFVAAVALGWRHAATVGREHAAAAALTRAHWVDQPAKNPHSAAHYGIYAFKPKSPLAALDDGVDPYVGVATWLEAHKQNDFQYRPAADATALQRFGSLTAAIVLQVLVPLVIVLLTFGAFAGEREQGTLRQLLSLGVPPRLLAAGKVLGAGLAVGALVVPVTAAGVLVLGLADGAGTAASAGRLALMGVAYLAYFAAWTGLSLAVSAWQRSARVALVTLLGVWMVATLLAPRAITDLVRALHPTPTAFAFAAQVKQDLEQGVDGHSPQAERTRALERATLARYGVDSLAQLPVNFAGIALQAGEEWANEVYDRRYGELWDRFERQEGARALAGVVAPVLAVRALSMGLAGTDVAAHRRFTDAAEGYRRTLVRAMNEDMTARAGALDFQYVASTELWRQVPPFTYASPPVSAVLRTHRASLAVLGGWVVLAGVLLVAAVRRLAP